MAKATKILEKSELGSAWVVIACPETDKVLLGKRSKDANNSGQWNLFGGGLERGESSIETALRELWEEAGIRVPASRLRLLGKAPGNMVVYVLDLTGPQARSVLKLNKLEIAKAKWFDLDALPSNLHKSTLALLHTLGEEPEFIPNGSNIPSMRNMLDVVEARKPNVLSIAKPIDTLSLMGRIKEAGDTAKAYGGMRYSDKWTKEIIAYIGIWKRDHDLAEQKELQHDPDYNVMPFDAKEVIPDLADRVLRGSLVGVGCMRELDEEEQVYQNRMADDTDDPFDYIESSDVLTCIDTQRQLVRAMEQVIPSRPATYIPVLDIMDKIKAIPRMSQRQEVRMSPTVCEELGKLLPVMIFGLKAVV